MASASTSKSAFSLYGIFRVALIRSGLLGLRELGLIRFKISQLSGSNKLRFTSFSTSEWFWMVKTIVGNEFGLNVRLLGLEIVNKSLEKKLSLFWSLINPLESVGIRRGDLPLTFIVLKLNILKKR